MRIVPDSDIHFSAAMCRPIDHPSVNGIALWHHIRQVFSENCLSMTAQQSRVIRTCLARAFKDLLPFALKEAANSIAEVSHIGRRHVTFVARSQHRCDPMRC